MPDWRKDERWRLVSWDTDAYKTQPPAMPPKTAEIANDPAWCSVYRQGRIVATWLRTLPLMKAPSDRRVVSRENQ